MDKVSRIKFSNKDLKIMYQDLNEVFFNGELPKRISVRFQKNLREEGIKLNGMCSCEEIVLEDALKILGVQQIQIVLLHEMIHLKFPEYVGNHPNLDHGMLFQSKIVELFNKGGYDGLL